MGLIVNKKPFKMFEVLYHSIYVVDDFLAEVRRSEGTMVMRQDRVKPLLMIP